MEDDRSIKEEVPSVSSASSSPTFPTATHLMMEPESDEERQPENCLFNPPVFPTGVQVFGNDNEDCCAKQEIRDTPCPSPSSSTSGCYSDSSCGSGQDITNTVFVPNVTPVTTVHPIIIGQVPVEATQFPFVQGSALFSPQIVSTIPTGFVPAVSPIQSPQSIHAVKAPQPIQIKPKPPMTMSTRTTTPTTANTTTSSTCKTIVLSHNDFNKMVNNVKTTNARPTVQLQRVKPLQPQPISLPLPQHLNGIIDERTWKKQQRLIKNRESACLSRRKKKEHVTSLEETISELTTENQQLKIVSWVIRIVMLCVGLPDVRLY